MNCHLKHKILPKCINIMYETRNACTTICSIKNFSLHMTVQIGVLVLLMNKQLSKHCLNCGDITIFVNLGLFQHFETVTNIRTWIKSQRYWGMLQDANTLKRVFISRIPIKNSYQDGLGRPTQTLDHVVVVHILIWDKKKVQINEYSDW